MKKTSLCLIIVTILFLAGCQSDTLPTHISREVIININSALGRRIPNYSRGMVLFIYTITVLSIILKKVLMLSRLCATERIACMIRNRMRKKEKHVTHMWISLNMKAWRTMR